MRAGPFSSSQIALLALALFFAPFVLSQQSAEYPETGTVRLLVFSMGTFKNIQYVITTNHAIYRTQCTHFKDDRSQEPDCSFDHKTITDGATIRFRVAGDFLLLPPSDSANEQQLLIDRTEMNPYPEAPVAGKNGVANGIIVAVANYKNEQFTNSLTNAWCASRPSRASEPNGQRTPPPAPATSKSASNGLQISGMSTAADQSDNLLCLGSGRASLDSFKLITSDRIYEVVCMNIGPCQVNGQPLRLGAKYFVRVESPNMWVATDPAQFGSKSEFHVISGLQYPSK